MTSTVAAGDEVSHRNARERRARIATVTSLLARGTGIAVSFVSVPVMARYLPTEEYGLFLTATSIATWLNLADLGIGNGLTNRIGTANAAGHREQEASAFATAWWLLCGVTILLALLFAAVFSHVPWRAVFAVSDGVSTGVINRTVVAVFGLWLAMLPLSVVEKALVGYQAIFVNNAWLIASGVASVALLFAAVTLRLELAWIVVAVHGPLPIARLLSGVVLLAKRPWLVPSFSHVSRSAATGLLGLGGFFFLAQLAAIGVWQTDQVIVAQLFGADEVPAYVTTLRICTLYLGVLMTGLAPLWPATTEAATRRDWVWIRQVYRRWLLLVMSVTGCAAVVFMLSGQWLVVVWAGDRIRPDAGLIVAASAYLGVLAWCQVHAVLLNALSRVRGQAVYGFGAAVINVVLSIWLGRRYGVAAVCWATVIATIPAVVLAAVELRVALRSESAG